MNKISSRVTLAVFVLALLLIAGCFGINSAKSPDQQQQPVQEKLTPSGEDPARELQSQNEEPGETLTGLLAATVIYVVDGDTVQVNMAGSGEERLRFIGVDTPEFTRGKNDPYGKEASDYTKSKLEGQQIWLELDVGERDQYGRMLAYVWLEKPVSFTDDEIRAKMFNAKLLLEGYAQIMTVPPNVKYAEQFRLFQHEARNANKGLWSLARVSQGPFVASARSNKYHLPNCESGQKITPRNLIEFKSVDEAMDAGYEPCRACNP